ncbi:MAG: ribosome-associated translation inhibitor RaiA [Chloroflexi bacterium]|nr:ribosome-associated translation inhibitor RaiA [Chloroflexota bacterium]
MEVLIRARNCTLPESVRDLAERKIGKLSRFLDRVERVELEVASEPTRASGERFVVQVTLHANGTLIRSQERASTIPLAVNTAVDKLQNQLTRFKERLHTQGKGKGSPLRAAATEESEEDQSVEAAATEQPGGLITRVKRFPMKPMDVDEAVQQMELLGHAFFLFLDSDSGLASLLYRRSDGTYGLIQPDLA